MALIVVGARLLLVCSFSLAGLAKLADPRAFRRAVIDFGVPATVASMVAYAVPALELGVAVALILPQTAQWGAIGATALITLFTLVVAATLLRGRRPHCSCFGRVSAGPIGWLMVARNGLLLGAGVVVIAAGEHATSSRSVSQLVTPSSLIALTGIAALGIVSLGMWLLLNLLKQHGRLLARIDQLEAQSSSGLPSRAAHGQSALVFDSMRAPLAPDIQLTNPDIGTISISTLRSHGKPVVLVFSNLNCGPCTALLPHIARWQQFHADHATIAVVYRADSVAAADTSHNDTRGSYSTTEEGFAAYSIAGTPSAIVIKPDGTIGSVLAEGVPHVVRLVTEVLHGHDLPIQPMQARTENCACGAAASRTQQSTEADMPLLPTVIGSRAPSIELPLLQGGVFVLNQINDHARLLLFWSPSCTFCTAMLDDLRNWEQSHPLNSAKLLLIAAHMQPADLPAGLQAPIALDPSFAVGRALGIHGTPSGVVLDATGFVASPIAAGANDVLALLNRFAWTAHSELAAMGAPDGRSAI